jgi:hypothetical protein
MVFARKAFKAGARHAAPQPCADVTRRPSNNVTKRLRLP